MAVLTAMTNRPSVSVAFVFVPLYENVAEVDVVLWLQSLAKSSILGTVVPETGVSLFVPPAPTTPNRLSKIISVPSPWVDRFSVPQSMV